MTEMGESIDGRRSFSDGRQSKTRLEEITTPGPRIPGSREELELKVVEADQKMDGLSKALAKNEEEQRDMEERYLRHIKMAKSVAKALQLETRVVKKQLQDKHQALINTRRSARDDLEAAERDRNRLAQELLKVRARNGAQVRGLKNALHKKEVAWGELLEELSSKNQELIIKDKELTKVCSQLAGRGEETTAAAAATAAPPGDSRAEVRASEMEQD